MFKQLLQKLDIHYLVLFVVFSLGYIYNKSYNIIIEGYKRQGSINLNGNLNELDNDLKQLRNEQHKNNQRHQQNIEQMNAENKKLKMELDLLKIKKIQDKIDTQTKNKEYSTHKSYFNTEERRILAETIRSLNDRINVQINKYNNLKSNSDDISKAILNTHLESGELEGKLAKNKKDVSKIEGDIMLLRASLSNL